MLLQSPECPTAAAEWQHWQALVCVVAGVCEYKACCKSVALNAPGTTVAFAVGSPTGLYQEASALRISVMRLRQSSRNTELYVSD
jgi:hypothetical protein